MRAKHWIGFLLVALIGSACGDDGAKVTTHVRDPNGTAGKGSTRRDGGLPVRDAGDEHDADVPTKPTNDGGSDGGVNPLAPVVQILEPKTLKDPNSGDVLIDPKVTVRCKVGMSTADGARSVNESTVQISRLNVVDPTKSTMGVTMNAGNGEFTADFDLSDQPNGPVEFACDASDVSKPPLKTRAVADTFLDLGPTIELLEPADGSSHRLINSVHVAFRVTDAPASLDDEQAAATEVHLVVSGQDFEFTADPTEAGLYTTDIDFQDPAYFPMPPETAEIDITAKSSRQPTAAEREVIANIKIDSAPPDIAIVTPKALNLVRGDVPIQITVSDPSGVDASSVIATVLVGAESFKIENDDWVVTKNTTYTGHFDTAGFDAKATQMTINVSATDNVGNATVSPATVLVRLDNVPPIVSLDPPLIREYKIANGMTQCSVAFDPVGANATNDLATIQTESLYRVMTWDETNHAPGEEISYVAQINNDEVKLYAQADPATPLLIDKDGDKAHVCDEINYDDLPVAKRPAVINLGIINRKGSPPYSTTADFDPPLHTFDGYPVDCVAGPASAPDTLCPNTEMTRAIPQWLDVANPPGAIFALLPTNGNNGVCNGNSWAVPFGGHEGWICIAARVEDTIGNVGISRPLRVCYDDPATAFTPDCSENAGKAISCADDCAPPKDFPANMALLQR